VLSKPVPEQPSLPSTGPRKSKAELKQHREQALRGQGPGQKRGTSGMVSMNSIIRVPDNAGNVFGDVKK